MGRSLLAAVLAALLLPVAAQAVNRLPRWLTYDRMPEYKANIDFTQMVPMRDGAQLSCSVYLPYEDVGKPMPEGTRFPTIINNINPYTQDQNEQQHQFLAEHGYAVVSCDARGSKQSIAAGPLVDPFGIKEQHDMYDLVEWAAKQPWSTGDVGIHGFSYGGIEAYLAAAQRPPHLRAIAAGASYASLYRQMVYLGGIRNLDVDGWQFGLVTNTTISATWRQHPLDDDYWAERSIETKYDQIRASGIPILDYGGWYDIYQDAEPGNYMALKDQTWLVMSPTAHLDSQPVGMNAVMAWFDHWLMKLPSAPLPDDKVLSYEMPKINSATGHGWTAFSDWPPPASGPVRMHLDTDATLSENAGEPGKVSYTVNPFDGSATYWSEGYSTVNGSADQQTQDLARVTFTTPPLKQDVVLAGAVEANIRAALSATDGNLVVRLMDVGPDGSSILASTGWLKASHRLGHKSLAPIVPGTVYDFPVHIWPTHWRFAAGHRIRLSVSSGDLPRIEPDAPAGTVEIQTGTGGSYADLPVLGAAQPAAGAPAQEPAVPVAAAPHPTAPRPRAARLGLPRSRSCASSRHLRFRVRAPRGQRMAGATVYVNGKRTAVASPRRPRVDLRGLPKARVRVRVVVVATSGRRFAQARVYRACARGHARH